MAGPAIGDGPEETSSARDLTGKTVVVTGGSSGIGRAAATALAARGAEVAVVGRNPERTRKVADQIGGTAFLADFDRFADIRELADALLSRYERIDVLANNAGGLVKRRALTADGHERTIQSNHLSPFLLTGLLLPRLVENAASSPVRIIQTASAANVFGRVRPGDLDFRNRLWLGGWPAYCAAKLANILFTVELARRTAGTGIESYAFHPGFVASSFAADTGLMKVAHLAGNGNLGSSPEEGAAGLIHLASVEQTGSPSGTYFDGFRPNGRTSAGARDTALAARLWSVSEAATA
ncbi:short-chain dehydrogenase [Subtercola boreus]|uniref:Short-chain dehydrogenase n=1 Tax=Subtercola boreus TaxID=120213 RepID=A0A3E0VI50_9MICO|nr:SDR family NAD(P)-dependent oxidoreductase [Subtercola boreus]RFA09626.1 short-chain dehydrogenase [Subtercola boreus]TQL53298.1 NAD(P)-dependent dehydrogenase (short-subunit alcohol dehydrogenase family) [Subtercola boreus]